MISAFGRTKREKKNGQNLSRKKKQKKIFFNVRKKRI